MGNRKKLRHILSEGLIQKMKNKKAVVLLSGGIDSSITLYLALKKGYDCFCLIFDYGQKHKKEIQCAKKIAKRAKCKYEIIRFELPWKGTSLLDKKLTIPKNRTTQQIKKEIPSTYVPARNTIFLSFALSFAEAINAGVIFNGANAIDYSGYPDCRPEYFSALEKVSSLGTKRGIEGKSIKFLTPLIKMSKTEIIKTGIKLKVPYQLTWSCYQGGKKPCQNCDSCLLRAKGFKELGITDPLLST